MDLTSAQITTLCAVFIGFHLLALPPFLWAMRHKQFRGHEQAEWHLDDAEAPAAPPAQIPVSPTRARWMAGTLITLAVLMASSTILTTVYALYASSHPSSGKCPF